MWQGFTYHGKNGTWNDLLCGRTAKEGDRTYYGFDLLHLSSTIFKLSACLCSTLDDIDLGVLNRGAFRGFHRTLAGRHFDF